ncbi:MAG: glycosyltransferase [Bdellovibrionales bacterium]|nr:glycosyltransferase [Bdellovibrionales bacterium]
MKLVHVFNSGLVSGPETLVLPQLRPWKDVTDIVFLSETRLGDRARVAPAYADMIGLRVHEVSVAGRRDGTAVKQLAQLLDRLAPTHVHSHGVKASFYLEQALTRCRVDPYTLVTHHGVRANRSLKLRFYEWIFDHLILPRFDRILTVCTSDRDLLVRRGLAANKIRVHLNGVDGVALTPDERRVQRDRLQRAWGLESLLKANSVVVGMVGRLAPEKRHARALELLAEVVRRDPQLDVHLVCFGSGPLENRLRMDADKLGLAHRVHWQGYRDGVGAEMAGFDLLLSLSDAEGLPINLVEAGWAATPVWATNVDGVQDLIPGESYGRLCAVTDSASTLAPKFMDFLRDAPERARVGQNFQRRVQAEFSGRVWRERLEKFYGELGA